MILIRAALIIIGLGAIAAVTHGTVLATGGYGWNTPASFYIALGCVQAGLAMALGASMVRGILPKLAAVVLLLMCEAANFLATVDLQLAAAEDAAAPIHNAAAARKTAEAWVARLDRDDRVERAEASAAKVQADAMAKSAEKGCAANCRQVLEAQVREAMAGVDEARQSLQLEQRQARVALDKAPVAPSATPLADKTGWQAWMIDLLKVGFRGFAVSIGAAILLAAGTHRWGGKVGEPRGLAALVPETSATKLRIVSKQPAAGDVHDWVVDRFVATEDASVPFRDLYMDYETWCRQRSFAVLAPADFGARLAEVCDGTDVYDEKRKGVVHIVNVRIVDRVAVIENSATKRRARLGQMARLSSPKAV